MLVAKTSVSESVCVTRPSGAYIQASPDYGFLSNFFVFISSKIKGNETSNRGGLHCAITTLNSEDETVIVNTS